MRNDSYTLKFYPLCDKRKQSTQHTIYLRITINRLKAEIATKFQVTKLEDWDDLTQRIRSAKNPINNELSIIEGDINDFYNKLKYKNGEITAAELKDAYLGRNTMSPLFINFIDVHFKNKVEANHELAEGTIKTYKATIQHLKAFLNEINKNKITLRQLDETFVRKFENYLSNCPAGKNALTTLKRNSVNKYLTKLKAMLNDALKEELISKSPFRNIKLKEEASPRTFLTQRELNDLEKNSLGENRSLIKVRDIFLFSVYTGLRFNDAINLKEENIDFDGKKHWVVFTQQKTKDNIRIPMLNKAIEIYDKYLIERNVTGTEVLQVIFNAKSSKQYAFDSCS